MKPAREIADGLAVDSRKKTVSCVELAKRIEKALIEARNEAFEEAAKEVPLDTALMEIIRKNILALKEKAE